MKKTVCHITSAHSRYDIRIFIKQCKSLAKNGYDVTLIVNDDKDDEVLDGVKIVSTQYKPENRMDRFLNSKKRLIKKAIEVNADIYQLHDPDLLPIGNKLKRLGKKVIFDSHEDVPRQINDKEWIPRTIRNVIAIIYEFYEKLSVKRYDGIISVTPHIVKRFKTINPNTIMITNYPIVDFKENIVRTPNKAICFAGGISPQWNHENIIRAIESIEDVEYILAGSGSPEYIESLKKLNGWNKVRYLGRISHEKVKEVYNQSMIGMTLLSNNTQVGNEGTLGNTKIFEFMEAGLPVICSNNRIWREMIEQYKCGIVVNQDNVREIQDAIKHLVNNFQASSEMGERGRNKIISRFNWKTQERLLINLYENIK